MLSRRRRKASYDDRVGCVMPWGADVALSRTILYPTTDRRDSPVLVFASVELGTARYVSLPLGKLPPIVVSNVDWSSFTQARIYEILLGSIVE